MLGRVCLPFRAFLTCRELKGRNCCKHHQSPWLPTISARMLQSNSRNLLFLQISSRLHWAHLLSARSVRQVQKQSSIQKGWKKKYSKCTGAWNMIQSIASEALWKKYLFLYLILKQEARPVLLRQATSLSAHNTLHPCYSCGFSSSRAYFPLGGVIPGGR